eukprot:m.260028 g.260028  ORF g.260028 m.260028 type:complete len:805 (-) comp19208_c4_seq1:48-2462(-)
MAARNPLALLERLSKHGTAFTSQISAEQATWQTKVILKINEAKNLPSRDVNGYADPFCLVHVDDELIARTSTVWKTLTPFFGEEFQIELSNNFQSLTVLMYDMDKRTANDPIGKLSFSRHQLVNDASLAVDKWYPLTKICRETQLYGEIFVELLLSETSTGLDELTVTIVKARDLSSKESMTKMDPFVVVKLDEQTCMTDRVRATKYPFWNQFFTFERARLGPEVSVVVRDNSGMGSSSFLGEAVIPLSDLDKDIPTRSWYKLQPRAKDLEGLKTGYGSLRCSVKFSYELILPAESYSGLMGFLTESVGSEEAISTKLIAIIQEALADRENPTADMRDEIPRTLVHLLLSSNHCVEFLKHLNGMEIGKQTESSTLFRGNSLATKCTDQFMKAVGLAYLHQTLKPTIELVFKEKKDCEIDESKLPKKLRTPETIQKHATLLKRYLEMLLESLFNSADKCPLPMKQVFRHIRDAASKNDAITKGQQDMTVTYTAVSGFVFLRFFAPAVLSPKLFGMWGQLADARTARTLTILAKALMAIGNLGSSIGSGKEAYMEPLHPIITENVANVRKFIDKICGVNPEVQGSGNAPGGMQLDAPLAEGVFPVRVANGSWAKREVVLSLATLCLSKPKDPGSNQMIKIAGLLAVEQLDASAFDKKYCLEVIHQRDEPVYINFGSENTCMSWLQLFRKSCHVSHSPIQPVVHAGVVKSGRWTCCKYKDGDTVFPCSKTHSTVMLDQFADEPNVKTWLHKLFTFLLAAKPKLERKYKGAEALPVGDELKKESGEQLFRILDDINLMHLLSQEASPK